MFHIKQFCSQVDIGLKSTCSQKWVIMHKSNKLGQKAASIRRTFLPATLVRFYCYTFLWVTFCFSPQNHPDHSDHPSHPNHNNFAWKHQQKKSLCHTSSPMWWHIPGQFPGFQWRVLVILCHSFAFLSLSKRLHPEGSTFLWKILLLNLWQEVIVRPEQDWKLLACWSFMANEPGY